MTATWSDALSDATRYEIAQHARNRVALALVLLFIPIWLSLVHAIIPAEPIGFDYRVADEMLTVDANRLSMISAAMNAVTLIIGFMMFSAVRRSSDFDRRLVLAGYPRSALLLAKLLALVLSTGIVAVYAAVAMLLFWAPEQFIPLLLSLFVSGLTYGGIGIVLGVVFRTELAGMFLIIMISLVDVMVQNPIITPSTRGGVIGLLPTHGAMQSAVGASFTDDLGVHYLFFGFMWLLVSMLFGLVAFQRRTRDYTQEGESPAQHGHHEERVATVVVTPAADGSLLVRSTTGPILLCSRLMERRDDPAALGAGCHCTRD